MEYNSQKDLLIISEYGRNIQSLINHAKTIEDKEKRQKTVNSIANLMTQMNPQQKNLLEYKDKIWRHIFSIAKYELDVETPTGKIPSPEDERLSPDPLEYPKRNSTFRHYGNILKSLVQKAISMEEGPKRDAFTKIIGSFMKMAYKNWNREHYVNDEIIKADLKKISDGKILVADDVSLDSLLNSVNRKSYSRNKSNNHRSNNRGSNNRSNHGRSNSNRSNNNRNNNRKRR